MIPDRDFDPCGNVRPLISLPVWPAAGVAELQRLIAEQAAHIRRVERARVHAVKAAQAAQGEAGRLRECEATLSRIAQMRGMAGDLARQALGGDEEEAA